MYKYSDRSLAKLDTCHEDLKKIANELIKQMDIIVICGYRGEREQNDAFINGYSKLQYPRSKHNQTPSLAMDLAPYNASKKNIDWNDIPMFSKMCDLIEKIACDLKIKIRLGRDFSFKDWPHVELHDKNKK